MKYKNWNVKIQKSKYQTGHNALTLIDADDGIPITTASVNLPERNITGDKVLIKSWSENEGMSKYLEENGIIGPVLEKVPTGYVYATLHNVLI